MYPIQFSYTSHLHRITTTAYKPDHVLFISSPFEDYRRSDGKGTFVFDGFEVYVSRFGIDGAEKSAWIEESIDVSECSTELHVGCVVPITDPSASTLRSHFHGTLLTAPEERITISLKSSSRQIVMQIRTCSSVLYEEVLNATTAFPGSSWCGV